jgi:hypothetical protein
MQRNKQDEPKHGQLRKANPQNWVGFFVEINDSRGYSAQAQIIQKPIITMPIMNLTANAQPQPII